MTTKAFAEYFIKGVEEMIGQGNFLKAGEIVISAYSGHGPAWTWEVEALYRMPSDDEENVLALKLKETLLSLAKVLWDQKKLFYGDNLESIWYCVSCLNKLGRSAPAHLIDEVEEYIYKMMVYDKKRAEQWKILASFLPAVSRH